MKQLKNKVMINEKQRTKRTKQEEDLNNIDKSGENI